MSTIVITTTISVTISDSSDLNYLLSTTFSTAMVSERASFFKPTMLNRLAD